MDNISLNNLTDKQNSLLTSLAYLDIDFQKFRELRQTKSKITISDLKTILANPNRNYLGDLNISKSTQLGVGTTNLDLIQELENSGLGNLEIVDFSEDKITGFHAICFRDDEAHTGFSYRGTDVKSFSSLAKDSLSDFEAFVFNNTEQVDQAQYFFETHANPNGNNQVYGHSLGGFLAENVYLQNHNLINRAFVINPLHINSQLLDTEEKTNAFNSDKFSCYVTGGDYVSSINEPTTFQDNVHYVQNNGQVYNNLIGNHLIEAAQFDETGTFVETTKEEAFKGRSTPIATTTIALINNNKIKKFFGNLYLNIKQTIANMKQHISRLYKRETTPEVLKEIKPTQNFDNRLKLENYIGENYTKQDLEKAQKIISTGEVTITNTPSEKTEHIH